MADRWMEERDRDWRDRDWRRSEAYGRSGEDRGRGGETPRWGEDRTWSGPADDERGPYERGGRDRTAYGEGGGDYGGRSGRTAGGGAYGPAGGYGGGEGYGRASGRPQAYQSGAERGRSTSAPRFSNQDYTGRGYADEAGRPDYGYQDRESYGPGRYAGREERGESGYGFERDRGEQRSWSAGEDRSYDRYGAEMRRRASSGYGGQGGYDERRDRETSDERRDRDRGEGAGDFLHRAGERISSWFRGDDLTRGEHDERGEPRRYQADYGREARWEVRDRGHRGVGPKGYRRSDERISEEVHERLTDDPWLDASNVEIEVKDGEVTLKGHVDNREAKHRAERLIEDLSGVRHVQNNLRVDPDSGLTSAGRGYGSSALEAEMRRNSLEQSPGNNGASGLSGRTSTGAAAERSTGTATEASVDPKTGVKRS